MSDAMNMSQLERFSYALGMSIASNLITSGVKTIDTEAFIKAVNDTFQGEMPAIMPDEANRILESFLQTENKGNREENLKEGLEFLARNRNEEGVSELPSGLQYKILKKGLGEVPVITDNVRCHYHGTLIDGKVFDSSVARNKPVVFPVNGVISGWVEALQKMPVGSKWRLFIPPNLAYGENGAGDLIGPNATLVFDVELLEIV